MKLSVIICEYNPLHNGHIRLIRYAKSVSDGVICVMSGNFTQRGLPACADKHTRAKHAIMSGADMVVELPTVFAVASAQNFAEGAVRVADKLNASFLVFGSEEGSIEKLTAVADKLISGRYDREIRSEMAKGVSYPKAVSAALGEAALDSPNNTLAVEYIKAVKSIGSDMTPLTLRRADNYNSGVSEGFASSSFLRENAGCRTELFMPSYSAEDCSAAAEDNYRQFAPLFLSLCDKQYLSKIEGIAEGLENRIIGADKAHGLDSMLKEIKTKRYTYLRLQRAVLNAVLGITSEQAELAKKQEIPLRLLAVKKDRTDLLRLIPNGPVQDATGERADKLYSALTGTRADNYLLKID